MVVINACEIKPLRRRTNYRNAADMLAEILTVVLEGVRTRRGIERAANLSFSQLKEYLESSLEIGMIIKEEEKEGNQSIYRITQKGLNFLRLYGEQCKMLQFYER